MESSPVPLISVVVPSYRCRECLPALYERMRAAVEAISPAFELILVNDASPDSSWPAIQALAAQDARVVGLDFSRNFGQHAAITAGLDMARGEWIVVMDCDLQDRPEEIPRLYAKAMGDEANAGFDVVLARRAQRQDSGFKKLSSWCFYKVVDYFTDYESDPSVANFGIYSRKVIDGVRSLREQTRFFPLMVRWLGYQPGYLDVDHSAREAGVSAYNFRKLMRLAGDNIIAQTNKPLRLSIKLGFLISLLAFWGGLVLIARYFFWGYSVTGWTSVVVSLYFLGGIIISNLGILGVYIGKIYDETKHRPLYVIRSRT